MLLDSIIESRNIDILFQPIVELESGRTVGFEALARGPVGTVLEMPDDLFHAAERHGRLADLDWVCRASAGRAALAGGLPADLALFVNIEPGAARTRCPEDLLAGLVVASDRLQIVAEVTERDVAADPAALLTAVAETREYANRIALDDVGAVDSSQALMSLLRPDVIKLDRSIVQGLATRRAAMVVSAVLAEAERTGAVVLAEGVETLEHADIARAMGATLAQGWLYGRPGALPDRFDPSPLALPRADISRSAGLTPFTIARQHRRPVTVATRPVLRALSRHLEDIGVSATAPGVLLATFQQARFFTPATNSRYERLAANGMLTAVYAVGMPDEPGKNIRGRGLTEDDPLTAEWNVVVIGGHFAGGLFAREIPPHGDNGARRFEVVLSYDRDLVIDAARPLIDRLDPLHL
jgi:EAL domain-containing protein (putative c-di-GMP-specific phosphodiesterase class I)